MQDKLSKAKECIINANFGEYEIANILNALEILREVVSMQQDRISELEIQIKQLSDAGPPPNDGSNRGLFKV